MTDKGIIKKARQLLKSKGIDNARKIAETAYSIKNYLVDMVMNRHITELDFYKITSVLSPQSRSPLWEKYFIKKHNCTKVNLQDNRGDFIWNGIHYEFKSSGYSQTDGMNIVQIRLWQDCDYIIQYISNRGAMTFILTHDQMVEETKMIRASIAHGAQATSKINTYNELRITVKFDSEDWERWLNKYKVEL